MSSYFLIRASVLHDYIVVIATDHTPHTIDEKLNTYFKAASGEPMMQHDLVTLLEMYHQGKISIGEVVEKTSHAVADCFKIEERGYIKRVTLPI